MVSGYMTRDMFLWWSICFINWLSQYRLTLPIEMRSDDALLILDGHTSRENPLAMCLFRKAQVHVLVLPSHTTHVLQWFDVGLSGPLKRFFATHFGKELKKAANNHSISTNRGKYRFAAVSAFLTAWR